MLSEWNSFVSRALTLKKVRCYLASPRHKAMGNIGSGGPALPSNNSPLWKEEVRALFPPGFKPFHPALLPDTHFLGWEDRRRVWDSLPCRLKIASVD